MVVAGTRVRVVAGSGREAVVFLSVAAVVVVAVFVVVAAAVVVAVAVLMGVAVLVVCA